MKRHQAPKTGPAFLFDLDGTLLDSVYGLWTFCIPMCSIKELVKGGPK
jgi:hypothetical protein